MKLGIRAYLLVVLGTLSVVPTFVLATFTASRAERAELLRIDRDSRLRAGAVARELDELIAHQTTAIELLAGQIEAVGGLDAPYLPAMLRQLSARSPALSFAYIADATGRSLVAEPATDDKGRPTAGTSYADRDYYRELMRTGTTATSRVQRGRHSGVPNVQIVAPIRDPAGALVGFAEGSLNLHALTDSIASAVEGRSDSRVLVLDTSGRVLADSRDALAVLADASKLPIAAPGARANSDVRSTVDESGRPVRVAHATLGRTLGWQVIAVRDQSSIQALANAARRDALVITAVVVIVVLIVVAFGVYWLARPIRALARATKAVGRGDFSRTVPVPRAFEASEVAELLQSVRDMTRDVQQHRDTTTALIAELETVNDQLKTMVVGIEHAGNPIEVVDAEGRLTYVNPAWERFTRTAAADAIGKSFVEHLGMDRAQFAEVWAGLLTGVAWRGPYAGRRSDGAAIEVELDAVPVVRADGGVSHVVATRIDITEQRRSEEVLRMNDRLAAVGTLAAGVAHEINNPLTYVTTNLELLRAQLDDLQPHMEPAAYADATAAFEETRTGIERVTNIVRDLKQLSRPDEDSTAPIDLNALLRSCVRMASVEIKHGARVECDYGRLPRIVGNEARLSQVFLNLLINAGQACGSDGSGLARRVQNVIRVATRADAGSVVIEISDTGSGIEPTVLAHIFDPFFTTKPIGVGTGLGLSICNTIVKALGGAITVHSTVGVGSTFQVTLPIVLDVARTTQPISAAVSTLPRARVLVVDDEPSIAASLGRMLRNHDVTVETSAAAALARLIAPEIAFDIVLSDIMMPELDGIELYRRACAAHPAYASAFIFMTGGIVQPGLSDEVEHLRPPVLYKPFTRPQVLTAVAAVLMPGVRLPITRASSPALADPAA